jgi:hypothetical protein
MTQHACPPIGPQRLFYWRIFAKIRPEKYDFGLCKGFFMENFTQVRQISKRKNSKSPDFYDKFQ